jgi:hypothetical protein
VWRRRLCRLFQGHTPSRLFSFLLPPLFLYEQSSRIHTPRAPFFVRSQLRSSYDPTIPMERVPYQVLAFHTITHRYYLFDCTHMDREGRGMMWHIWIDEEGLGCMADCTECVNMIR